ncbi:MULTISPECIES: host attachment protein [Modicisalibacter]|uniref:host attachment protein n=1 Tax=Modicisalibacter TaxID=574347 RepID=UPI00100B88DC|nr:MULTISPECIES: host attachment protein [Halomonadaceae]MBZ9558423.1 host attachment protein [Modicisalibacter sp. R2A 31.J]MBZ9575685.1 host attachment protein [Modicisalibacter sp. MOD 31.J]
MTTYIVATDAARARVFAYAAGKMNEVEDLSHPESREHTGDLRTGGKGESGGGGGANLRQTGNDDATSDKHAMFFAKEVAGYLKDARSQGKADSFVIIAEPRFLGLLRDKMDSNTRDMVVRELDKDLSKASKEKIAEALGKPYA